MQLKSCLVHSVGIHRNAAGTLAAKHSFCMVRTRTGHYAIVRQHFILRHYSYEHSTFINTKFAYFSIVEPVKLTMSLVRTIPGAAK